jgi:hypothetical protein
MPIDTTFISAAGQAKLKAYLNAKTVKNPRLQDRAEAHQIYKLKKSGDLYYIFNASKAEHPNGVFLFIINASSPGEIICGSADPLNSDCVRGHTSLSNREPVLYAGELLFDKGRLINWTNCSGHYQPSKKSMGESLIPYVKLLLPEDKFSNVFDEHGCVTHNREMLMARGYEVFN